MFGYRHGTIRDARPLARDRDRRRRVHLMPGVEMELERRLVLASLTGPLGNITFEGNPKDIVAFKQLIENSARRSIFFASELQRIAFNQQSREPILIIMSREPHTTFGDNYGSNEVWIKDLESLPTTETAGNDAVTQG